MANLSVSDVDPREYLWYGASRSLTELPVQVLAHGHPHRPALQGALQVVEVLLDGSPHLGRLE